MALYNINDIIQTRTDISILETIECKIDFHIKLEKNSEWSQHQNNNFINDINNIYKNNQREILVMNSAIRLNQMSAKR